MALEGMRLLRREAEKRIERIIAEVWGEIPEKANIKDSNLQRKTIMTCQEIENKVVSILEKYNVKTIGIFGSYARGAQSPDSDLDVLVNFKERKSLLTLVRIEREISEAIGVKVDLLTEQSVSPYLIDRIKSEIKIIYQ